MHRFHSVDNCKLGITTVIKNNISYQKFCSTSKIRVVHITGSSLCLPDSYRAQRKDGISCRIQIELIAADKGTVLPAVLDTCDILPVALKRLDRPAAVRLFRELSFSLVIVLIVTEGELSAREAPGLLIPCSPLDDGDLCRVCYRSFLDRDFLGGVLRQALFCHLDCIGVGHKAARGLDLLHPVICFHKVLTCLGFALFISHDLVHEVGCRAVRVVVDAELSALECIAGVIVGDLRVLGSLVDLDDHPVEGLGYLLLDQHDPGLGSLRCARVDRDLACDLSVSRRGLCLYCVVSADEQVVSFEIGSEPVRLSVCVSRKGADLLCERRIPVDVKLCACKGRSLRAGRDARGFLDDPQVDEDGFVANLSNLIRA